MEPADAATLELFEAGRRAWRRAPRAAGCAS
jgi:hypothetical protein